MRGPYRPDEDATWIVSAEGLTAGPALLLAWRRRLWRYLCSPYWRAVRFLRDRADRRDFYREAAGQGFTNPDAGALAGFLRYYEEPPAELVGNGDELVATYPCSRGGFAFAVGYTFAGATILYLSDDELRDGHWRPLE